MKRILIVLTTFLCLASCNSSAVSKKALILDYSDFGPAAMSEPLLGQSWWQWQQHGDSKPSEYDIKVIVYQSQAIEDIKHSYPVTPEQQKDYRYVTYQDSINYLDSHIEEDLVPHITNKLVVTKQKIVSFFKAN